MAGNFKLQASRQVSSWWQVGEGMGRDCKAWREVWEGARGCEGGPGGVQRCRYRCKRCHVSWREGEWDASGCSRQSEWHRCGRECKGVHEKHSTGHRLFLREVWEEYKGSSKVWESASAMAWVGRGVWCVQGVWCGYGGSTGVWLGVQRSVWEVQPGTGRLCDKGRKYEGERCVRGQGSMLRVREDAQVQVQRGWGKVLG